MQRILGKAPGIIKIESTDRQIDRLVYELYGLTEVKNKDCGVTMTINISIGMCRSNAFGG